MNFICINGIYKNYVDIIDFNSGKCIDKILIRYSLGKVKPNYFVKMQNEQIDIYFGYSKCIIRHKYFVYDNYISKIITDKETYNSDLRLLKLNRIIE